MIIVTDPKTNKILNLTSSITMENSGHENLFVILPGNKQFIVFNLTQQKLRDYMRQYDNKPFLDLPYEWELIN